MSTIFRRRCSCVKAYTDPKYRFVNIVFKEAAEAPLIPVKPSEWADKQCPHCHGDGFVYEQATNLKDIEAMKRDMDRRMAFRK
jgi:hypothetical protein